MGGACIENETGCIGEGGRIKYYNIINCCSGLNKISDLEGYPGNCAAMDLSNGYVCTSAKCGDGKCELEETHCNCPMDCNATFSENCRYRYWLDSESGECHKVEFCGVAHASYPIKFFDSLVKCEHSWNSPKPECINESDCPQGVPGSLCQNRDCGNVKVICIEGKCEPINLCPEGSIYRDRKCIFSLSNGIKSEIKIMPETAFQIASEELGDLGFTTELKEVKESEEVRAIYELIGNKQGRFLGIFKITARINVQIDAQTGQILEVRKPWWSFLAIGV